MAQLTRTNLKAELPDNVTHSIHAAQIRDICDSALLPEDIHEGDNVTIEKDGTSITISTTGGGGGITAETDPVVGAVDGIVKADGAGNISAAVPSVDYSVPSDLANVMTLMQHIAGLYGLTRIYTGDTYTPIVENWVMHDSGQDVPLFVAGNDLWIDGFACAAPTLDCSAEGGLDGTFDLTAMSGITILNLAGQALPSDSVSSILDQLVEFGFSGSAYLTGGTNAGVHPVDPRLHTLDFNGASVNVNYLPQSALSGKIQTDGSVRLYFDFDVQGLSGIAGTKIQCQEAGTGDYTGSGDNGDGTYYLHFADFSGGTPLAGYGWSWISSPVYPPQWINAIQSGILVEETP